MQVRKAVIGAILATDMVHHFPMVSRLEVGVALSFYHTLQL